MSLPIAVIREILEFKEKTLKFKFVFVQEPLEKSQVRCSAVAAEPPLPHEKKFLLFLIELNISIIISGSYTHLTLPTTPYV